MKWLAALVLYLGLLCSVLAQGGMGPGPGMVHSAGSGCAEATAFLARTSGLDGTHQTLYTNLICGLVTNGQWAKIDTLYIEATQDSTTSRLNVKSTSFSPLTTSGGTPVFTADRGHTYNGSALFLSGFTPSTAGGLFTQNSAHLMVWSNTTGNSSAGEVGTVATANALIVTSGVGTNSQFHLNAGSGFNNNTPDGKGFFLASRTASNNMNTYWGSGGTLNTLGSSATASTALPTGDMNVGAVSGFGGSNKQLSAAGWGGALTGTEVASYYTLMQAFMTGVGN